MLSLCVVGSMGWPGCMSGVLRSMLNLLLCCRLLSGQLRNTSRYGAETSKVKRYSMTEVEEKRGMRELSSQNGANLSGV